MLPRTLCCLRQLSEYLRNDGSAVKNVWLIQLQGYNYININTTLKIMIKCIFIEMAKTKSQSSKEF